MSDDDVDSGDGDNWLNAAKIDCPACGIALYRVEHSPFIDASYLYCDRCPIHADVSWYDPAYGALPRGDGHPSHDVVEAALNPCACGGTFRYAAPRRCLTCHAPVIVDEPDGIDLTWWSPIIDDADPSDEAIEADEQRHAAFERKTDLWRA